jgi:hypothetical protein
MKRATAGFVGWERIQAEYLAGAVILKMNYVEVENWLPYFEIIQPMLIQL